MAYSKTCSQQSVLQLRSQKLSQQRFVIDEKNDSKRKVIGKISTLSEHVSLLPKSHLNLPKTSLDDDFLSLNNVPSPVVISGSQIIQSTEITFSNNSFNLISDPNLVASHICSPSRTSELIEYLPIYPKDSPLELGNDNPCRLINNDNLSESEGMYTREKYLKSPDNVFSDFPPVLSLLPQSSLSSFPDENDISNFVLTPIINYQVILIILYFLEWILFRNVISLLFTQINIC